MTVNPPHDYDDPQGYLNGLETALLASERGALDCSHYPHCHITKRVIAMSGPGWGVELFHEPHCPEHDDNLPTPERPSGGGPS
jgi:hypothetical protein